MWLTTRSLERGSLFILFFVGLIVQFAPYRAVQAATVTPAGDHTVASETISESSIYLIQFQKQYSTKNKKESFFSNKNQRTRYFIKQGKTKNQI